MFVTIPAMQAAMHIIPGASENPSEDDFDEGVNGKSI